MGPMGLLTHEDIMNYEEFGENEQQETARLRNSMML